MDYALDRLGYLQFQRICAALMELEAGVDPRVWDGNADRLRSALSDQA